MRLMWTFFRAYPVQCSTMLVALLLAGLMEGINLSALLPLLNIAIHGADADASGVEQTMINALAWLGLSPTIGILLSVILVGSILKNLLGLLARKKVGYTVAQVTTDLRLALLRALLATRWEYFLTQRVGGLANAMSSETMRASDAYVNGTMLLAILIQAMVYTVFAFLVSWQATLGALALGGVLLAASHGLVVMARRAGKHQTRLLKSLLSRLTDTLQSVKGLKAMAREQLADRVLRAETEELNDALQQQVFSKEVLDATQQTLIIVVMILGIYIALVQWQMPLAEVLMLALLLGRVLSQLSKVQRQYQKMASYESAFWSLQETIHHAEQVVERAGGDPAPLLQDAIRFQAVGFGYGDHPVVDGLFLEIPAGGLTTLVGPSGAGKTTVVDLVIGLLAPQQGEILIDGTPLQQVDLRQWRETIGYVPQDTLLLHDTLLTNITLGDSRFTTADAERALRGAGAWDFVSRLPEGLATVVGERGARLSGGQRQRISIARALVHRPRLLILDEATSALDPETEAAICATLRELQGQLTVLAISHQAALMRAADRVYRLEAGQAQLLAADAVVAPA